jgi:hypothetical protein
VRLGDGLQTNELPISSANSLVAPPSTPSAGHAFVQNIRRGHYELAADAPPTLRVATAFDELAQAV